MITALATVQNVKPLKRGFEVQISCEQQTSCSHCASQKNCGTGILSKAVGNKSHQWALKTDKDVKTGQIVEVGLPEKSLIQFASVVYILPLMMLIAGAIIGQWLIAPSFGHGEGVTILVSVGFMACGLWLSRFFAKILQSKSEQSVKLLRVIGESINISSN